MEYAKKFGLFALAGLVGIAGFLAGEWALMCWLLAAAIAAAGVIDRSTRWGIVATAALGLGASAYLFRQKLAAAGPSICNINDVINCDIVNNSPQSEIAGMPISLLGAGFFLGVAVAGVLAKDAAWRLYQVTALLAGLGVLYSVYLAFVASQLGAICVMCITIYLCTALLAYAGWRGTQAAGTPLLDGLQAVPTSLGFVTIAATLAIVVLVGNSAVSAKGSNPALQEITGERRTGQAAAPAPDLIDQLATSYAKMKGPVELTGTEPVLGDPNAPYLVVEFADYGCPHCAEASVQLKQLVNQLPEVQVRFRPFALSGACNPALASQEGPERCRAAMAAECAHKQGKFWEVSSTIFANQRDLSDDMFARAVEQNGLDLEAWATCMQDRETVRAIAEHGIAGARAGVAGTPALFLRGTHGDEFIEVCWGPEAVLALIEAHQSGVTLPPPTSNACLTP